MADEYIRKADAIDAATQDSTENRTHSFRAGQARSASRIKAMPSADVAPVVHAYWIHYRCDMYECSVCQRIHTSMDVEKCDAEYCPHCGAKMDAWGEE